MDGSPPKNRGAEQVVLVIHDMALAILLITNELMPQYGARGWSCTAEMALSHGRSNQVSTGCDC